MASISGRLTSVGVTAYSMSKAALIAFSDGLRRELKRSKVHVIELEPWVYRTTMADRDVIGATMRKMWEESADNVQKAFGQKYYEQCVKALDSYLNSDLVGEDVNEVIDSIVDALCLRNPRPVVRVVPNNWFRLYIWLTLNVFPQELVEFMNDGSFARMVKTLRS